MAKYVECYPNLFASRSKRGRHVRVWWFPEEFSQSQLGDRTIGSTACTLIALILAGRIDEYQIPIFGHSTQPLSRLLVASLAEAIVEGNELHEILVLQNELADPYLTVPEALHAVQHKYPLLTEWKDKTLTVVTPLGESFLHSIAPTIYEWAHNPPPDKKETSDLFIVLVADGRSVLFVFQPELEKITVIDTHTHMTRGAGSVVAQTRIEYLEELCSWFCLMCRECFGRGNSIVPYELAFLYPVNSTPS